MLPFFCFVQITLWSSLCWSRHSSVCTIQRFQNGKNISFRWSLPLHLWCWMCHWHGFKLRSCKNRHSLRLYIFFFSYWSFIAFLFSSQQPPAILAKHVLAEIPKQVQEYFSKHGLAPMPTKGPTPPSLGTLWLLNSYLITTKSTLGKTEQISNI